MSQCNTCAIASCNFEIQKYIETLKSKKYIEIQKGMWVSVTLAPLPAATLKSKNTLKLWNPKKYIEKYIEIQKGMWVSVTLAPQYSCYFEIPFSTDGFSSPVAVANQTLIRTVGNSVEIECAMIRQKKKLIFPSKHPIVKWMKDFLPIIKTESVHVHLETS